MDWTRIPDDYLRDDAGSGDGDYSPYITTVGGIVKIVYASRSWWNGGVVNNPFVEGYWVRVGKHEQKFYTNKEFFEEQGYVPISHKLVKILFSELVNYPWPLPENPEDSILFNKDNIPNEGDIPTDGQTDEKTDSGTSENEG